MRVASEVLRRESPAAGDMDLDPETGQYRFSATVPGVEVNALRETLGVRPLPFPVSGAIRGTLHCTGPLEEPAFSGAQRVGRSEPPLHSWLRVRGPYFICLYPVVSAVVQPDPSELDGSLPYDAIRLRMQAARWKLAIICYMSEPT